MEDLNLSFQVSNHRPLSVTTDCSITAEVPLTVVQINFAYRLLLKIQFLWFENKTLSNDSKSLSFDFYVNLKQFIYEELSSATALICRYSPPMPTIFTIKGAVPGF